MLWSSFSFLLLNFITCNSYILPQVYREFHPIAIHNHINKNKPFFFNIGKLPMILWFNDNKPITTINSCKHLGNNMNDGYIKNNCFICPFHKTTYNNSDNFGTINIKDGLVWWNYKSFYNKPPSLPLIDKNNDNYNTINFKLNYNINFINFIINLIYINDDFKINYIAKNKKLFIKTKNDFKKIRIFYKYPYSIIVDIQFQLNIKSSFMINLLPIAIDKTRLYITIKYKKGFFNYIYNSINAFIIKYYLIKFKNKYENSNNDIKLTYLTSFKNNKNDYISKLFNFYNDYMDLFSDSTFHNFLLNKNFY